MTPTRSDPSPRTEGESSAEQNGRLHATRPVPILLRAVQNGSVAVFAGCAMLVRATRSSAGTQARAIRVAIGTTLIGIGLRQRRSNGGGFTTREELVPDDGGRSGADSSVKTVADDAHSARERHGVTNRTEANPRGVPTDPDGDAVTGADEDAVRFTADGEESRAKPTLGDEVPGDPRYDDESDEGVAVDLSEASLADEASEATGPDPEQAEPAQVEDTEPDRSPPEDTSHMQADVPDGSESGSASEGETEGAADSNAP
ncbi:prolipoprotein diacylglyceryl transferase [Natrinema altunense]|uniref:Uncharacterized protein n=1 Tax=Natrinema altunense TaxID=222984 RepID=A0A482XU27_9EURY|nr:hypothetical protein [Natrinema altunense]RZH66598.1 hypothetical protein ELS17_16195 [Natrinema altunense]